jgi:RNA polymerase sigma-70 factor (ECF subfamily)
MTSLSASKSPAATEQQHRPTGTGFDLRRFEDLYREHAGLVLSFLRRRVPAAVADDLSQQVWLKVWTQASTRFDGQNFRAWVFQIARNILVDSVRKQSRWQAGELADVATADADDDAEDPRTEALKDCLTRISRDFFDVVRARMLGEPYEAICERLSIPIGTAHSRFNKAKLQLQACVEEKLG